MTDPRVVALRLQVERLEREVAELTAQVVPLRETMAAIREVVSETVYLPGLGN